MSLDDPADTRPPTPRSGATSTNENPRPRSRGWRLDRLGIAAVAAAGMLGVLGGLGSFTFGYGEGASYLSNDPTSCINCHVMQPQFESWTKSSHHAVATCNDCHLPHDPVGKWVTKADNGFFHSLAFTTGDFPEPIRIKDRNRRVTQSTCLHCHGDLVDHMHPGPGTTAAASEITLCIHCHADVGHAAR